MDLLAIIGFDGQVCLFECKYKFYARVWLFMGKDVLKTNLCLSFLASCSL